MAAPPRVAHRRLRFYFDFISPYAWLAWRPTQAMAKKKGIEVEPIPILFAGLLNHWGQLGPAEIPPKRAYVLKDTMRKARQLGLDLPVRGPPSHPFRPLLPLRAASYPGMTEVERDRLILALFDGCWSGGKDISDAATISDIAQSVGLSGADIIQYCSTEQAKQKLRRQTDEAIQHGVFGVPAMVVDDEVFWGVDAIPFVDDLLSGTDCVDPAAIAKWMDSTRPTAWRSGVKVNDAYNQNFKAGAANISPGGTLAS